MKGTVKENVGFFKTGDVIETIEFDVLSQMYWAKNLTQNFVSWVEKSKVNFEK